MTQGNDRPTIVPVLGDGIGYVRLVDHLGSDVSVVNAARASFLKETDRMRPADVRLLAYLSEHRHDSPYRHAVVSLEVKAPLMVARQLMKYRVGSGHTADTAELVGVDVPDALLWAGNGDDGGAVGMIDGFSVRSEASRRYLSITPEFYVPDRESWRGAPENRKQGSSGVVSEYVGAEATRRLLNLIRDSLIHYEWALEQGICAEQARLFLPAYGLYTVWRWTLSLQGLAHVLDQRLAHDAQKECQSFAVAIRDLTVPLFPHSLSRFRAGDSDGDEHAPDRTPARAGSGSR